jgi:cysteine desulfurase
MERIYLDWASTSPVSPEIAAIQTQSALNFPGNPSSVHSEGRAASARLEDCRQRTADIIGAEKGQVFFTSGGTESDAIVLQSFLNRLKSGTVVIPRFEHPAVWEYGKLFARAGIEVVSPSAGPDSRLSSEAAAAALKEDCILFCCMAVHNETGAIQPLKELVETVREAERRQDRKIHVHCDAVQAAGKRGVDIPELLASGVDSLALSGHKIRAPRGVGMLYLRQPLEGPFPGGGQERGIRPGTENLPAIEAFAAAMEMAVQNRNKADIPGRRLLEGLSGHDRIHILPRSRTAGSGSWVPSIVTAAVPPLPSEVLVRVMNDRGFAISAGSACSNRSGKKQRRALEGSGISREDAEGAFRISLGPTTSVKEIDAFLDALFLEIERLIF